MRFSLAPMEGITGHIFRCVHAQYFGALDLYYTPFLTPPQPGTKFSRRALLELDPATNAGLKVVPQLLTKDADAFIWTSHLLADLGYDQVNLNLGCPSNTVVPKGKGSGFLRHLAELDAFLGRVCKESPLPVSVKTRLGVEKDSEFEAILALYARHPLAELIVHPRVQKDFYKEPPRQGAYGAALAELSYPVAYNGDIFCTQDFAALISAYPQTQHVMLGRGILANPAFARTLAGGAPLQLDELERFHDALFESYLAKIGGNALFRMKEWWFYARCAFERPLAVHRKVRKVKTIAQYREVVSQAFATEPLAEHPQFRAQVS